MKKDLIIERMEATIEKMKLLIPEKFDFSCYVKKGNIQSVQGEICDIAGWYPLWFPDSELEWYKGIFAGKISVFLISSEEKETGIDFSSEKEIKKKLVQWHGISKDCCKALFYPEKQKKINEKKLKDNTSLEEVTALWERVLLRIKSGETSLLNED